MIMKQCTYYTQHKLHFSVLNVKTIQSEILNMELVKPKIYLTSYMLFVSYKLFYFGFPNVPYYATKEKLFNSNLRLVNAYVVKYK